MHLWLLISFLLLVALSYKKLKSFIADFTTNKIDEITNDINESNELLTDTNVILYEAKEKFKEIKNHHALDLESVENSLISEFDEDVFNLKKYVNLSKKNITSSMQSQQKNVIECAKKDIVLDSVVLSTDIIKEKLTLDKSYELIDVSIDKIKHVI